MNDIALLVRMLPWLVAHPGTSTEVISQRFGISKQKVLALLNLLVFTGPSQFGGGLVDIALDDEDYISVIEAQNLDSSVRLDAMEAAALVGGLRFLKTVSPDLDISRIDALIAKLVPAAVEVPIVLDVVSDTQADERLTVISAAIASETCLEIDYASASQGNIAKRLIEPVRITTLEDRKYVEGWCRQEELYRSFRVDRIISLAPVSAPQTHLRVSDALPEYRIRAQVAVVPGRMGQIEPGAVVERTDLPDGRVALTIEINSMRWLAGIVIASAGDVEALAPEELRTLICEMIAVGLD